MYRLSLRKNAICLHRKKKKKTLRRQTLCVYRNATPVVWTKCESFRACRYLLQKLQTIFLNLPWEIKPVSLSQQQSTLSVRMQRLNRLLLERHALLAFFFLSHTIGSLKRHHWEGVVYIYINLQALAIGQALVWLAPKVVAVVYDEILPQDPYTRATYPQLQQPMDDGAVVPVWRKRRGQISRAPACWR